MLGEEDCTYTAQCWLQEAHLEKCGWGFPDSDARYADVVVSNFGLRTIEYDPPTDPETHDCLDTESFIGSDGTPDNPLIFEYAADTRTAVIGDCAGSCSITNDHGEDDDTGTAFVGEIGECAGNPVTDPSVLPLPPGASGFIDPIEGSFSVLTYDEEQATPTGWSEEPGGSGTHRAWRWDSTEMHSNDDTGVLARHQCFDTGDNDVDWTTTCENLYDVTLSDLITTAELITAASSLLATTEIYTSTTTGSNCTACFNLSASSLQCHYISVLVRITNVSVAPIVVTWNVNTYSASTDPESPCTDDGDPPAIVDPDNETLSPGEHVDIPLYPDTSGANIVMRVENIVCSWAP